MALSLVTAPAVEPVSLGEAKVHLRVPAEVNDEDALIANLIAAAREQLETVTRRLFITTTMDWKLDAFPDCDVLELPVANISSITSITYVDTAGVTQTWSSTRYVSDLPTAPKAPRGRIEPAYGEFWPTTRAQVNAVTIRFVAGFGSTPESVPESLRTAIKMLAAHWFNSGREPVAVGVGIGAVEIPKTVDWLAWPYRAF